MSEVLVLGIGNVLLGDEGVGVHAARALERRQLLPPDIQVVDGGTGGFHLLGYLQEHERVIFLDAALDGRAPGTVRVMEPRFASDFPRVLSAHDIGLRDLLESAALLGSLPQMNLVAISIEPDQSMTTRLSPPILGALEKVLDRVQELVAGTRDRRRRRYVGFLG